MSLGEFLVGMFLTSIWAWGMALLAVAYLRQWSFWEAVRQPVILIPMATAVLGFLVVLALSGF